MLNISSSSQYALRALVWLVRRPENKFATIRNIACKERLPYNYLSKLFQHLIKENILESNVGPSGGVRLSPKGWKTPVTTIIKIIDGPPSFDSCTMLGTKGCSEPEFCTIHLECRHLGKTAWNKLKKTRLGDFHNGK